MILEFGPGTGALTDAVAQARRQGIELHYLGIERDPGLCEFVQRRYPELDFVQGDATDVRQICRDHNLPLADAVVSGLPLMLMEPEVLDTLLTDTTQCMRPGAVFRTISHVHCYPSKAARRLRETMSGIFERSGMERLVLANLPPMFVLSGTVADDGTVAPAAGIKDAAG